MVVVQERGERFERFLDFFWFSLIFEKRNVLHRITRSLTQRRPACPQMSHPTQKQKKLSGGKILEKSKTLSKENRVGPPNNKIDLTNNSTNNLSLIQS